jgi:hypothetical protein
MLQEGTLEARDQWKGQAKWPWVCPKLEAGDPMRQAKIKGSSVLREKYYIPD